MQTMARFAVRVDVVHRPGILDPQGATIERALPALGYDNVSGVEVGKSIHLLVDAPDEDAARGQVDEMCKRLLTNPVLEDHTVEVRAVDEEHDEAEHDEAGGTAR